MREILFRAKRTDNKEWIEGSYIKSVVAASPFGYITPSYPTEPTQIYTVTLGQWTGVYDKNGKKIFDGDIISIMFETDGVDGFAGYSWYETAEVVFSEEKHAWIIVFNEDGEEMYLNEFDKVDDVVVIANIYDEPKSTNN